MPTTRQQLLILQRSIFHSLTPPSLGGYSHVVAKPASTLSELPTYVREAVKFYWQTRAKQVAKQKKITSTPASYLTLEKFAKSLVAQGAVFSARIKKLALPVGPQRRVPSGRHS
jgi:hypothetical protein